MLNTVNPKVYQLPNELKIFTRFKMVRSKGTQMLHKLQAGRTSLGKR